MIRKILVPTDFSASAEAALKSAVEMAKVCHAELVLLHVRDEIVYMAPDASGYVPAETYAQIERAAGRLLEAQTTAVRATGLLVRSLSVLGSAHAEIVSVAQREGVDLIVMGTHGRRGFRRLILGSVAERVARTAEAPVMVVQAGERPAVSARVEPVGRATPAS